MKSVWSQPTEDAADDKQESFKCRLVRILDRVIVTRGYEHRKMGFVLRNLGSRGIEH